MVGLLRRTRTTPAEVEAPLTIRRAKIETFGGSFDTVQYEAVASKVKDGDQVVGGVADLTFTPNELVEGKVGLVQTGKATRDGASDIGASDAGKNARAQKKGDVDPGRFLDRSNRKENPVFGLEDQKREMGDIADAPGLAMDAGHRNKVAADNPGATVTKADQSGVVDDRAVSSTAGAVGSRTAVPPSVVPAKLRDEPARNRAFDDKTGTGQAIEMRFESAALGLSGKVEGAYLGSVEWGFEAPANSATASPLPFRRVSMGAPSAAFSRSAELWNDQKTTGSGSNTKMTLPVAVTTHATDPNLEALLDDASTPPDKLTRAIEDRIALLQRQIPTDVDGQIAALRSKAVEDKEAASGFQDALEALQAQWKDVTRRFNLTLVNQKKAGEELAAATKLVEATRAKLNVLTALTSSPLKAARKDKDLKQQASESAKRDADTLEAEQRELAKGITAAKDDPDSRAALVQYRDRLVQLQNLIADANSRSFEVLALRARLPKSS